MVDSTTSASPAGSESVAAATTGAPEPALVPTPVPDASADADTRAADASAAADVTFRGELRWKKPRNVLRDTWVSATFELRNRELSWTVPGSSSSLADHNLVEVVGWTALPDRGGRTQPHRFDLLCCKPGGQAAGEEAGASGTSGASGAESAPGATESEAGEGELGGGRQRKVRLELAAPSEAARGKWEEALARAGLRQIPLEAHPRAASLTRRASRSASGSGSGSGSGSVRSSSTDGGNADGDDAGPGTAGVGDAAADAAAGAEAEAEAGAEARALHAPAQTQAPVEAQAETQGAPRAESAPVAASTAAAPPPPPPVATPTPVPAAVTALNEALFPTTPVATAATAATATEPEGAPVGGQARGAGQENEPQPQQLQQQPQLLPEQPQGEGANGAEQQRELGTRPSSVSVAGATAAPVTAAAPLPLPPAAASGDDADDDAARHGEGGDGSLATEVVRAVPMPMPLPTGEPMPMPDWVMRAAGAPGAGEIPLLAAAADGSGDVVATIAEDGPLGLRLQGTDPPPPVAGEPPALPDTLFVESVAPGSLSARVGIVAGLLVVGANGASVAAMGYGPALAVLREQTATRPCTLRLRMPEQGTVAAAIMAAAAPTTSPSPSQSQSQSQSWACAHCTFVNEATALACSMCGQPRSDGGGEADAVAVAEAANPATNPARAGAAIPLEGLPIEEGEDAVVAEAAMATAVPVVPAALAPEARDLDEMMAVAAGADAGPMSARGQLRCYAERDVSGLACRKAAAALGESELLGEAAAVEHALARASAINAASAAGDADDADDAAARARDVPLDEASARKAWRRGRRQGVQPAELARAGRDALRGRGAGSREKAQADPSAWCARWVALRAPTPLANAALPVPATGAIAVVSAERESEVETTRQRIRATRELEAGRLGAGRLDVFDETSPLQELEINSRTKLRREATALDDLDRDPADAPVDKDGIRGFEVLVPARGQRVGDVGSRVARAKFVAQSESEAYRWLRALRDAIAPLRQADGIGNGISAEDMANMRDFNPLTGQRIGEGESARERERRRERRRASLNLHQKPDDDEPPSPTLLEGWLYRLVTVRVERRGGGFFSSRPAQVVDKTVAELIWCVLDRRDPSAPPRLELHARPPVAVVPLTGESRLRRKRGTGAFEFCLRMDAEFTAALGRRRASVSEATSMAARGQRPPLAATAPPRVPPHMSAVVAATSASPPSVFDGAIVREYGYGDAHGEDTDMHAAAAIAGDAQPLPASASASPLPALTDAQADTPAEALPVSSRSGRSFDAGSGAESDAEADAEQPALVLLRALSQPDQEHWYGHLQRAVTLARAREAITQAARDETEAVSHGAAQAHAQGEVVAAQTRARAATDEGVYFEGRLRAVKQGYGRRWKTRWFSLVLPATANDHHDVREAAKDVGLLAYAKEQGAPFACTWDLASVRVMRYPFQQGEARRGEVGLFKLQVPVDGKVGQQQRRRSGSVGEGGADAEGGGQRVLEVQAESDAAAWGWVRRIEFVQEASGIVAGAGAGAAAGADAGAGASASATVASARAAAASSLHAVSESLVSPVHVHGDPSSSRRYSSGRGGEEESKGGDDGDAVEPTAGGAAGHVAFTEPPVVVEITESGPLGLRLIAMPSDRGICVKAIVPDSLIARPGLVEPGMLVARVNDQRILECTYDDALAALAQGTSLRPCAIAFQRLPPDAAQQQALWLGRWRED